MTLRRILPGILVLAFILAACAPAPQLRDETLISDTGLITGDPCEAPCWRGITPGETSWRDALTVVEDSADFENLQTQEAADSDALGAVWNAKGGPECCQMVAQDGETVNLIFVRNRPENTLGELIDAHGEPTYAIGQGLTEDQALLNLVYPDLKVIALVFMAGETASVSEDSEIIGALYTTEADMELFLQTQFLHDWDGYGPFSDYRLADDADYELTPSVTLTPTPAQ